VAHRLICPGSEHALAQWLETDYVPDRGGADIADLEGKRSGAGGPSLSLAFVSDAE